jgi:hypothetical protein
VPECCICKEAACAFVKGIRVENSSNYSWQAIGHPARPLIRPFSWKLVVLTKHSLQSVISPYPVSCHWHMIIEKYQNVILREKILTAISL